jgi:hypothetical protein
MGPRAGVNRYRKSRPRRDSITVTYVGIHIQRMPQNRIPLKPYNYRPQGRRSIGRPKKRWREQLQPWRWNGSKGPILDVYEDIRGRKF